MILFYLISEIFILAIMGIAVIILVYALDSAFGGLDFTTSRAASRVIAAVINEKFENKPGVFMDLGCCRGDLALAIKSQFPQLDVYGIDDNLVRLTFAKAKARLLGSSITFLKQDFFLVDVADTDIAYIYLDKALLPRLEQKLKKELKPGAMVITSTHAFSGWSPVSSLVTNPEKPNFEKLFVYEKA